MNKVILHIILMLLVQTIFASNVMYLEPINVTILNTANDEFAPSWNNYTATLYYTSKVEGTEKLYTSNKNADGFFQEGKYLDAPINKVHENISYINFLSEDKAYFSSFLRSKSQPRLQLFYSNYQKKAWSEGFPIEEFASDKFVGQSSISPDKNQIVFTVQSKDSDLDLMVSYRLEDGSWREPILLEIMNSIGDEITPHFASDDTLYFASNGQGGPGGFDIYFSVKSEGIWQRPSPLYELNTEYDESDVCRLPNGDILFASNRPGGVGGLDIWLASNNNLPSNLRENTKLDINLQSYITNIIVNNNYEYTNLPVSSVFFLDDSTMELQSKLFVYKSLIDLQKINSIDESYTNSLNYIGHRLARIKNAKLKIKAHYPGLLEIDTTYKRNSKYYADLNIKKIHDYLTTEFLIPPSQIVIEYEFYQDDKRKPSISLSSSENEIFAQMEIRKDKIEVEQKLLPIDVRIEPAENLSNWLAVLNLAGEEIIVYENKVVKDRFTIDLVKYKHQLFESDFMNVFIKAYSYDGDSTIQVIPHSVEHHFSKKPKLVVEGSQYYDYNYIIAGNDQNIESNNYIATLEKIYSSISMCKTIEISYNKRKKFAESLRDKLQSKIVNNQLNVNIIKSSKRTNDTQLDENLIIIKVEKFPSRSSNN
jgi:WD40 repeat protein